jgi:two-component system, sensor histidine kinase
MNYPIPSQESMRMQALVDLKILDTPPDPGLDTLINMARRLFDVPISLVSLIDENRQWFKSKSGLDACETDRKDAFCAHAIMTDEVFTIEDATLDPRFYDNPLVTGAPFMKAYAGAPLSLRPGIRIGTICIIDTKPRRFSSDDLKTLQDMADLIIERVRLLTLALDADERSRLLIDANRLAARAQVVLATMSDGVVVQDRTGAIVSANDSAGSTLGLTVEQLIGLKSIDPRWQTINEDGSALPGQHHPAMITLATGLPVNNVTLGVEQPDQARRWLRVSSRPLFEDDPEQPSHAVVTFSDITEIVEKSRALKKAQEVADAASRAKSAFLANVSHEIRTPLNAVIGLTSVLSQSRLGAAEIEMVELIKTSGETLERLLSDILDVSKIEAGKLELSLGPMDLHATISAAAQLIGLRADEKGIEFSVNFGPDTSGQFLGDGIRLRQIITNLASNAIKFTSEGKVTLNVDIDENRKGRASDTWVKIAVNDTGRGFDEETASRLFSRFEQADSSITRAYGGTGLGLSICKSLTEMMGGTIESRSTLGVGSTFCITIPLIRLAAAKSAPDLLPRPAGGGENQSDDAEAPLRVLMAEDHPINQRVTSLCLASINAEIVIAQNGRIAVDDFKAASFDIILMDMQMPEMDGLQATRLIRHFEAERHLPRTPIAMLSANAMPEQVQAALEAGCDHHIAKPVTPASLIEGIEEAMRLAQQWSDRRTISKRLSGLGRL